MVQLLRLLFGALIGLFQSAGGVKPRSWFFASRSTCSGASRQSEWPSATSIVWCLSGCIGWFRNASGIGGDQPRNGDPLAPRRLPSLLALEIKTARWPAKDTGGDSPAHSRDEHREPALGRTADPRRTAQARHRCRADHGRKVHGESIGDHRRRAGGPSFAIMPTASHRWICSWSRPPRFGCSTPTRSPPNHLAGSNRCPCRKLTL